MVEPGERRRTVESRMTNEKAKWRTRQLGCTLLAGFWVLPSCMAPGRVKPVVIENPVIGRMTVAVAPAVNLSGSSDFDASRFADLMASELSYAQDVSVIPVSRVLGVLAAEGVDGVKSPVHAMELVGWLGADAILVFAVTEYDPYDPPSIGISAQLYGAWPRSSGRVSDPVALGRQASGPKTVSRPAKRGALSEVQRVFDASHRAVVADIQAFAKHRNADRSPYGWRKYVVSQQEFIRYCCNRIVGMLLNVGEQSARTATVEAKVELP